MTQSQRRTRFVRHILYSLKRRYGAEVAFFRDSEAKDLRTGKKTVTKAIVAVKRAIVLPNTGLPKFVYDLSYIATNKNFTMGGVFDTAKRRLILDSRDIGSYVPANRDYFTYENRRWNIIETQEFEIGVGWMIVGQEVQGAPVREWHEERARNRCIFTDEAESEVL
jgi:hypothetical protein